MLLRTQPKPSTFSTPPRFRWYNAMAMTRHKKLKRPAWSKGSSMETKGYLPIQSCEAVEMATLCRTKIGGVFCCWIMSSKVSLYFKKRIHSLTRIELKNGGLQPQMKCYPYGRPTRACPTKRSICLNFFWWSWTTGLEFDAQSPP